jgi:tetratricopeptide (TPR) repeat protein
MRNAERAVFYNPDSARAVLSKAVADLYLGAAENAARGLSNALRLDPGNPQVLLYMAQAYGDSGNREEQERTYQEIIKWRPNFWPAYNDLGFALYRQGKYQEAATVFGEAAVLAPKVAMPLTNQAAMLTILKRTKEAEEAFRRSLQLGPTHTAHQNLGSIAFQRGDYRTALQHYEKAREMQPKNDLTWRNLGDCYAMLGQPEQVTEHYKKASELMRESLDRNPQRGAAWMTLGFYEARLGRRGAAEDALKKGAALGAVDVQSRFMKSQALWLLGRKEEALSLVFECLAEGLSTVEVELAIDLKDLRADPRYQWRVKDIRQ